MNNLRRVKLGSFFTQSVAGEWGSEPTGIDDVTVYRAADFSKDCKLNVTEGALRSVPKSKLSNRKLNRNDILVEKSGGSPTQPVGRAVIYKPESDEQVATCSNFLQRLVVDAEYSPEFIYYLMLGLYQANATLPYQQQTTGIYNLKLEEYLQTEVDTYVDRTLQEKLADILSTIDNQIDATQALIDKYTAIKQGMMADLFSRGIDPETKALRPTFEEAPELYYKTPLGILPKGWDIAPFEQLSEVIDPNPSHRYPDSVSIDGVPIASTENFEGTDGFNLVKSKLVPDSEFEKQFERCKYQKDDVIFARKGRIGFARQYGDAKKVFSHTVVVMKAKAGVSPDFLLWLARSTQYLEAIDFKMNSNSGVPTLGVDVIKRVRVAVPSVEEQQDIAKCLNQINKKIHTELAFLAKTKAQKSGLMQDLLTGKVPVAA